MKDSKNLPKEEEPIKLRIEKGDKLYILECPIGTTLGELYDVANQYRSYAIGRMKEPDQKTEEGNENGSE